MQQYLGLLRDVLENGKQVNTRGKLESTGKNVDALSVFGRMVRFNLADGFPAVTTKRLWFKGVVAELIWFLSGSTDNTVLTKQGVHIWDKWAKQDGDLGPIYGQQWRSWSGNEAFQRIDQIAQVIEAIRTDNLTMRRRLIVSAWNVADIPDMAMPPCHCLFQFNVQNGKLNCLLYQRSADIFLGVPFNIASYALLVHMVAHVCGLQVGEFVHTFGDLHVYMNHLDQVSEQLNREPHPLPQLKLNPAITEIEQFTADDIKLVNYTSHSPLPGEVAI